MQNAEEEGVEFVWLSAPKGFTGGAEVDGVMVQKMRLGAPDATGRQSPELIEGADYVEPADLVIQALGFEPEELPTLWGVPELDVTRWGTIKADFRTHETSLPGVYAAGDIVRGASWWSGRSATGARRRRRSWAIWRNRRRLRRNRAKPFAIRLMMHLPTFTPSADGARRLRPRWT